MSIPEPDREGVERRFVETPLEVIDVGWCVGQLSDGRPFRAEHTKFCGANYLTLWFSALNFPIRDDAAFAIWLAEEGFVRWGRFGPYAVAGQELDRSSRPVWWVKTGEDWTEYECLLEMRTYIADSTSNTSNSGDSIRD